MQYSRSPDNTEPDTDIDGPKQEMRANAHETRDSISLISYAGCLDLSAVILAQFTIEMCVAA